MKRVLLAVVLAAITFVIVLYYVTPTPHTGAFPGF